MKRMTLVLTLAIAALSAQRATAEANLGLRSVGASLAYVSPENLNGTFGVGVFADMGRITPEIALEPRIDYWSKTQEEFGAKASVSDIAVGARGKYYFEVQNPNLRPFAGAGLGLHFLHSKVSVTQPGFPTMTGEASDTKLGLDLGGGVATSLSPKVDFSAEAWYGIVSDVGQFSLRVGLSQKLGPAYGAPKERVTR